MPSQSSLKINYVITADNVRTIVDRAFDEHTEIVNYEIVPYCDYAIGFLGEHKSLEITIRRDPSSNKEKHIFFAKAEPQSSAIHQKFIQKRRFFNQEADFYNCMMPQLLNSYKGEKWAPKCYLATDKFVVVEDIRTKGYKMCESKIFTADHLKSAAKVLARMHACSVLAEKRLGKSLKDVYPEVCVEQIFMKEEKNEGFYDLMLDLITKIAERYGQDASGVSLAFDSIFEKINNPKEKNRVISHTDTWPNNFMFKSDVSKCLVVDFQLVRYGNRMWDISQLVYFGSTQEIRDKGHTQYHVVKAYHEEFNEVIARHDPDIPLPSLADTLDEYEDARVFGLFSAMFYFPFVLVSKEEYQRLKDRPEDKCNRYMLRISNDYVLKHMEHNEIYRRRITETALELMDYSKKLLLKKNSVNP